MSLKITFPLDRAARIAAGIADGQTQCTAALAAEDLEALSAREREALAAYVEEKPGRSLTARGSIWEGKLHLEPQREEGTAGALNAVRDLARRIHAAAERDAATAAARQAEELRAREEKARRDEAERAEARATLAEDPIYLPALMALPERERAEYSARADELLPEAIMCDDDEEFDISPRGLRRVGKWAMPIPADTLPKTAHLIAETLRVRALNRGEKKAAILTRVLPAEALDRLASDLVAPAEIKQRIEQKLVPHLEKIGFVQLDEVGDVSDHYLPPGGQALLDHSRAIVAEYGLEIERWYGNADSLEIHVASDVVELPDGFIFEYARGNVEFRVENVGLGMGRRG